MTSDTGLCGSYNQDLIQIARRFLAEQSGENQPLMIGIGKAGISALQSEGYTFEKTFTDLQPRRRDPERFSGLSAGDLSAGQSGRDLCCLQPL